MLILGFALTLAEDDPEKVAKAFPHLYNDLSGLTRQPVQLGHKQHTEHLSSSTEDLKLLFGIEKKLVAYLNQGQHKAIKAVKDYLAFFNQEIQNVDGERYVSHPVNAFSLMKRTSTYWPLIKAKLGSDELFRGDIGLGQVTLPDKKDFIHGAAGGLVNAHLFHDLNLTEMIRGVVANPLTGTEFKALHDLAHEDVITVANAAKAEQRFDSYVSWMR